MRLDGTLVAGVAVAASQLVVRAGQLQTLLDRRIVREFAQLLFVVRQGLAPAPLAFERLAVIEQSGVID